MEDRSFWQSDYQNCADGIIASYLETQGHGTGPDPEIEEINGRLFVLDSLSACGKDAVRLAEALKQYAILSETTVLSVLNPAAMSGSAYEMIAGEFSDGILELEGTSDPERPGLPRGVLVNCNVLHSRMGQSGDRIGMFRDPVSLHYRFNR